MSEKKDVDKNQKAIDIIKKILFGIAIGIFGVLLLLVIWLAVDKFIIGSPVPSVFGYSTLTVETGSMSGTIEIGDMIIIKDTGDYKIGDIITFIHEGESIPTTHRIINYNSDGSFVTKGDANNVKDTASVTADMIFGEVVKVYPKIGLFGKWVRVEGWIYIVAVLAIVGIGAFILKEPRPDENESNDEATNDTESSISDTESSVESDDEPRQEQDTAQSKQGELNQESKQA